MTLTVDSTVADASTPAPRRRRWPLVIVGLLAAVLVAAGTSAVVYAHTYSPLGPGSYGGGPRGHLRAITDGISNPTRYIIDGPSGSTGRVEYSIDNTGRYPVKILRADTEPNDSLTSVVWSRTTPGGNGAVLGGLFTDARPFPMTMPPGDEITLWTTVTKPDCAAGSIEELSSIPLETEALHVHHEWDLPLTVGGTTGSFTPAIDVCFSKSALKHLSHGL